MKKGKHILNLYLAGLCVVALTTQLSAGNKDRVGQSGADELRINPWAQSTGMASSNSSCITGLESMHVNVAGIAFTHKTDLLFTRTNWMSGSGININSFGFSQRLSETSVLALGVMSMSYGDIEVTTVNQPEGGNGVFTPQYMNLGLSYAKEFSNSIYGGLTVKSISEGIADAKAQGVAFDAGIRYVSGDRDQLKFGIALRNVGPKMYYSGDGFATKVVITGEEFTLAQRAEGFELPALLTIGASYDLYFMVTPDSTGSGFKSDHKVTVAGTFVANSFGKDQYSGGFEYTFMEMFQVRAGYMYESGINTIESRTTVYTGPTAGASIQFPFGQTGSKIGLDYSYRTTNPFDGTHSVGVRINI